MGSVQIGDYCEWSAGGFSGGLFQAPLNMTASLVMLGVGIWLVLRLRDAPVQRQMAMGMALIGATAAVFHATGNAVAGALALGAIALYALLAIYRVCSDLLGLRPALAAVVTVMFLPFTAATVPVLVLASGFAANLGLAPVPVLLLGTGVVLRGPSPRLAREFLIAAVGMFLAIGLRAVDSPLCEVNLLGTHFLYILLATAVLARLTLAWARHALAAGGAGR